MNVINITEEQREKLCNNVANLVNHLKQFEDIECIYIASYIRYIRKTEPTLNITIVKKNPYNKDDVLNKIINFYKKMYQNEHNFKENGIKFSIEIDKSDKYNKLWLNPSELLRYNFLFNSQIIYDRTGDYSKLKQIAETYKNETNLNIYYYENKADLQPPAFEKIKQKICS